MNKQVSFNNVPLLGAESSPALLASPGRHGRRSSLQEKKDTQTEKQANEEPLGRPLEKRPGDGESVKVCSSLLLL